MASVESPGFHHLRDNLPLRARLRRSLMGFTEFLRSQVIGSVILLVCTIIALLWANVIDLHGYEHLWETELAIQLGDGNFSLTLHQWINDGLMALFFLGVGLEIKREVLVGELSSLRQAALPIMAAIGGMLLPALVFSALNAGEAGADGWGVPVPTDIAFTLGILALLGSRVPLTLKIFVTALAIADDIGAVLLIALFYTESIHVDGLLVAGVFLAVIFLFNTFNIERALLYVPLAVGVWFGIHESGIHATVAGILVALLVPAYPRIDPEQFMEESLDNLETLGETKITHRSILTNDEQIEAMLDLHEDLRDLEPALTRIEHNLHPYVAFLVLPLFALSNAGVVLEGDVLGTLLEPLSLGVILGLVVGKQVGITLFTWLAVRLGIADLPEDVGWMEVYGVSWLAGVGFTMSLFITELAFTDGALITESKIGILAGSLIAGMVGYLILNQVMERDEAGTQHLATGVD
jgi:NhaA family Na+:H+ antiporter